MAMAKCKECGKEVSTRAKMCPHCGVKKPVMKKKSHVLRIAFYAVIAIVVINLATGNDAEDKAQATVEASAQSPGTTSETVKPPQDLMNEAPAPTVEAKPSVEHAPSKEEETSKAQEEIACARDLKCWSEKYQTAAGIYCADDVEKLANYSSRWTDKFLEPKFSHVKWLDKEKGFLSYSGDKIQFQNGFGAWQNHRYTCDFDPRTKTVLGVSAEPGRL